MRYKVSRINGTDRGEALFQQDMDSLLRQSPLFSSDDFFSADVYTSIRFENDEKAIQQNVVIRTEKEESISVEQEAEIKRMIERLKSGWRPAMENNNVVNTSYMIRMQIKSAANYPIGVYRLDLGSTSQKTKFGLPCFQSYNINKDYEILRYLFTASEIMAEYNGGLQCMANDINMLLDISRYSRGERIQDSCTIDFIVNREGKFGLLDTYKPKNEHEELILKRLRQLSCNWKPGISGGRRLNTSNKYRFFYSYVSKNTSEQDHPRQLKIDKIVRLRGEAVVNR
ncbi:hypothetical protein H8B06_12605 [Sphingobacterium sp. DN00404]|uniref:Uncharacterized protein n=1 Tax=Sphingobacterium micropteri TaxID=2763501 RepID=A0ABR7YR43_9SPHI|nr:hypothetical protein [Sphingobacterium micropteri]MBD1433671.1 hypothetical protein [Sphingobacterium micropteri]